MAGETGPDLEVLIETLDMAKEESLKVVQSLCKKLACDGDEIMFMTVNMALKTTTCIGSQLGVNFLNHKPFENEESPTISQMFQQFLEDHYEISNVCSDIPFSPAGSVIMQSPSYTPFSSPRPYKAVNYSATSDTGKLLTPKVEVIDSEYEGNSTATESQDECQQTVESIVSSLPSTPKNLNNFVVTGNESSPRVPGRSVLAGLLTAENQNPSIHGFVGQNAFTRFQSPVHRNSLPIPGFRSPNIRTLLARLLSPNIQTPVVPPQNVSTSITFPTPGTKVATLAGNQSSIISPKTCSSVPTFQPTADNVGINWKPITTGSTDVIPTASIPSRKKGRSKGNVKRVNFPVDEVDKNSDEDDDDKSQSKTKTVTLRSGRKVRVPSWRKEILEESLKTNRKKLEEISEVKVKQERISPTLEDSDDENIHVEFDFDLLAELKKESETDAEQSEDSSWSGTVLLTSGDDSTPSKVPFKFKFPDKKQANSRTSDFDLSSVGLARKPPKTQPKQSSKARLEPLMLSISGRNKFNYNTMFDIEMQDGNQQHTCKICKETLGSNVSLKNHCFSHESFQDQDLFCICRACDQIFQTRDELKEHIPRHANNHTCHTCKEQFVTKLSLIQHLNWVHKEMYSCPKCDRMFISSKALSYHLSTCFQDKEIDRVSRGGTKFVKEDWVSMKEDGKLAFKCRSCKDSFDTIEGYNQHMLQHKSKFVSDVNEKVENSMSSEEPLKENFLQNASSCEVCEKIFETPADLTLHKRRKHGKSSNSNALESYKCSLCNIHFDTQIDFFSHCTKLHNLKKKIKTDKSGEFSCDKCCKKMLTKEGLEIHQKIHDPSEMKNCDDCGILLHAEANKLHRCLKEEDSEFKCQECNKCFYSHLFLTGHLNYVHGKSYEDLDIVAKSEHFCKICGRVFKKASDLHNHSTIHTGEMPYMCHLCHKNFRLRSTLKTHLMTHRDYHEFMCEVCGRTFKLVESLRLHRRLHNKTCHFKCKYCTREFRAYDGLKYHMVKSHKEHVLGNHLKIYKCEHCGKDMATHQQYIRHVSIHTNDKPLKCDQCDTRWATVSQLNAHKKKHDVGHLRFQCDVCRCKFPIMSKLKRHINTAKHIENCKAKNLPADTIHLNEETSVPTPPSSQPLQIINNITDLEEKVEIMFYEINLPENDNEYNEKSMVYDLAVDPEDQGQDSALYNTAGSEGLNADETGLLSKEAHTSLLNTDVEMLESSVIDDQENTDNLKMEEDNLKICISSEETSSDFVGNDIGEAVVEMDAASLNSVPEAVEQS